MYQKCVKLVQNWYEKVAKIARTLDFKGAENLSK